MEMKKLIYLAFLFLISYKLFAVIPEDTSQVAEKVYLHVDRSMYTSGEDIWFKAYAIDPSTNKLSLNTTTSILNSSPGIGNCSKQNNQDCQRNRSRSFSPDSIPSVNTEYVPTQTMRNLVKRNFVKEIIIVNPNETDELQLPVRKISNKIDITFFSGRRIPY
jgi:hypothetical protein